MDIVHLGTHRSDNLIGSLKRFKDSIPEKVCITIHENDEETKFTYDSLWNRSCRAAELIVKNTDPGDRVLLILPTSPQFVEYFFGCLLSGRIAVPLPIEKTNGRFSRLENVIADCGPRLAIVRTEDDRRAMGSNLSSVQTVMIATQRLQEEQPTSFEIPEIENDQVAFIQYTSGSTATPKGVVITQGNLAANLKMIKKGMNISSEDQVVSWLPLHHDMGLVGNLLTLLDCGASTFIYPYQEFARNPLSWLKLLSDQRATISGAPNFAFDLIIKRLRSTDYSNIDLSQLRLLYCGSERISSSIINNFFKALASKGLNSKSFFPCYGLAEACLYVSGGHDDGLNVSTAKVELSSCPVCGIIADGLSLKLMSDANVEQPSGTVGSIFIAGPSVSVGYWKDINTEIKQGIYQGKMDQWIDTGDLGFKTPNNKLIVTGRKKDLLKINGRNIYPEDVEFAIERLSDWFSANSVVVICEDKAQDRNGITVVAEILRNRRNDDFSPLISKIKATLGSQNLQCKRVVLLSPGTMPKTSSGKKQRSKTAVALLAGSLKVISNSVFHEKQEEELPDVIALRKYLDRTNLILADERRTFPNDLITQLHKNHFLGLLIPRSLKGNGLSNLSFARVGETLGMIDLTLAALVGNHNTIGVIPILKSNVLVERESILNDIATNGRICAFAITESNAGSNPRAIVSSVKKESGKLVLRGEKIWIGNAQASEYISVFAKEFDEQGREIGISAFLVQTTRHEFMISEEQLTLGLRAMPQNRVLFDHCIVEEHDRLTPPGEGLQLAYSAMEYARFGLAAMSLGAMKSGFNKILAYAEQRQIWTGRLSLNDYFVQSMSEIKLRIQALNALVNESASRLDATGELPLVLSLSCKIAAGEWVAKSTDMYLQFAGGRGYTEPFGFAKSWRDARVIRIFEGPTEALAFQLGNLVLRDPGSVSELIHDKATRDRITHLGNLILPGQLSASTAISIGCRIAEIVALALLIQSQQDLTAHEAATRSLLECMKQLESDLTKIPIHNKKSIEQFLDVIETSAHGNRSFYDIWPERPLQSSTNDAPDQTLAGNHGGISSTKIAASASTSNDPKVIKEKLRHWLKVHTRAVSINDDISIANYGFDSLLAYELLCFAEEEFATTLSESIVTQKPSINELAALIQTSAVSINTRNT